MSWISTADWRAAEPDPLSPSAAGVIGFADDCEPSVRCYGVFGRDLSCFFCSSCFCFVSCCCLCFSLSFLPPLSPMPAPSVVIVATSFGLEASREANPKVIVSERRIELTAQRDAANGVRVAPRSAARGTSHALVGAGGISLR